MLAWCWSSVCPSTGPGLPMKFPKNPECESPCQGVPKPILKPHMTHTNSTIEKVAKHSIMLLIDQRFCITPPYRTARPGMLIKPTRVAAVICQEVSPELSQVGASSGMGLLVRRGQFEGFRPADGHGVPRVWAAGVLGAMASRLAK